ALRDLAVACAGKTQGVYESGALRLGARSGKRRPLSTVPQPKRHLEPATYSENANPKRLLVSGKSPGVFAVGVQYNESCIWPAAVPTALRGCLKRPPDQACD